jgi:hypothetical protein
MDALMKKYTRQPVTLNGMELPSRGAKGYWSVTCASLLLSFSGNPLLNLSQKTIQLNKSFV